MRDAFRYRVIDEPTPGPLAKLALPPMLVFMVGIYFLPWGGLLIAFNSVAINGPARNREIACALAPIMFYFSALALLNAAVISRTVTHDQADYLFVLALGIGMVCAAFAFLSQARTFALRSYLASVFGGGR